jgi:sec-independent protein translocase protein TatA
MGLGNVSLVQLLIVLVIVVLIFGTKRLKSIGSDLGSAIKGFRSSMTAGQDGQDQQDEGEKPEDEAKPLQRQEPDAEFPEQRQNQNNRKS